LGLDPREGSASGENRPGPPRGLTLARFILKNQLCLALWQIISTGKRIKSIALDLGYKPGSFSERFKKEFGVSPSKIRRDPFQLPIF